VESCCFKVPGAPKKDGECTGRKRKGATSSSSSRSKRKEKERNFSTSGGRDMTRLEGVATIL